MSEALHVQLMLCFEEGVVSWSAYLKNLSSFGCIWLCNNQRANVECFTLATRPCMQQNSRATYPIQASAERKLPRRCLCFALACKGSWLLISLLRNLTDLKLWTELSWTQLISTHIDSRLCKHQVTPIGNSWRSVSLHCDFAEFQRNLRSSRMMQSSASCGIASTMLMPMCVQAAGATVSARMCHHWTFSYIQVMWCHFPASPCLHKTEVWPARAHLTIGRRYGLVSAIIQKEKGTCAISFCAIESIRS